MKINNINTGAWDKQFKEISNNINDLTDDINDYLLQYFKHSFDVKAFGNEKWKPSKDNPNTLVDTKTLKNSIKTVSKSPRLIHIQSDTAYSAIHNYGGKIKITDKMRKFFWAKYYSTRKDMWKGLALTKKTHITIPKRTYMGWNDELRNKIEDVIIKVIKG